MMGRRLAICALGVTLGGLGCDSDEGGGASSPPAQDDGAVVGEGEGEPAPPAGEGEGEPPARVCDPGETQGCACPGDSDGAQICRDDLQGWSPCECAPAPTAPTALACLPGEEQDCDCDNGRHGKQPCLADGSDWGGCVCADGPACDDGCQRGSVECVDETGGYRLCRDSDNDGCVEWTPDLPCPDGRSCFQGDCTPDAQVCDDDCAPTDTQCLGNGVQGCEEIDDDACLDWAPPVACAANERCEGGRCVERQAGDECSEHSQCGEELGLCDGGECEAPYGRFWEVIVATGHVAEPVGDLFDDPDPLVVITVNDEEFRTEVAQNTRDPAWFAAFQVFIRRGDPFRWRLADADLFGEERVGAWEFGEGVPIDALRTGSVRSVADDGVSFVSLFFLPSEGPEPDPVPE